VVYLRKFHLWEDNIFMINRHQLSILEAIENMSDHVLIRADLTSFQHAPWLRNVFVIFAWGAVWIMLWNAADILAVNYGISAWYPPAAISLFMMIRYGPPAALAIFVASFLAGSTQWATYPGHHEILGSLGHVVAYLAPALLYRRATGRNRFSIRPKLIPLFLACAVLGAGSAAVLGNINFYFAAEDKYKVAFIRLFSWGLGDFFGVISLCPLLLFVATRFRRLHVGFRKARLVFATPLAALSGAIALAVVFALIAGGSGVDFRLLSVVGVGSYSVIVAHVVSPRSAVIYLFFVSAISAVWLSTEVAPEARIEFSLLVCTFLIASFSMIGLAQKSMKARVAATNRRLRMRELSEQRDALSRRIEALEVEFAQLAHEFKTPLSGIIGLLHVAEIGMPENNRPDQLRRLLQRIRGCAWYLNAMVDDAFDVARIAQDRFEPVVENFSLLELLDQLEIICQAKVGDEVVFLPEDMVRDVQVRSDRNRLLQILINLLVNAHRYADRPGSVRVICAVAQGTVTLSIENASGTVTKAQIDACIAGGRGVAQNSQGLGIGLPLVGKLAAGIGAQLSTAVSGGVVTMSVTIQRL
jgi:signal transduction histidine kinase